MIKIKTAIVLIVSAAASIGARQARDPLDDLFEKGRVAQAAVNSASASFTETTVSSLLREPIVAHGTLIAAKPARVVMTYAAPNARVVRLDDTRLVVVWPDRPGREQIDISETQRRIKKYFVDASARELRQSFDITVGDDPSVPGAYLLNMTPKRKQIQEGLQRLRLWIDRTRLIMVKMTLDYPGGDRKTLELQNVHVNVPIDAHAFDLPAAGASR